MFTTYVAYVRLVRNTENERDGLTLLIYKKTPDKESAGIWQESADLG